MNKKAKFALICLVFMTCGLLLPLLLPDRKPKRKPS